MENDNEVLQRGHLVPKDEAIPNDTKRSESDELKIFNIMCSTSTKN